MTSSATVHGSARAISVETGVGKADSDGPKSPTAMRRQKVTYWSHNPPCSPYSSLSDCRIISIASGLMLPNCVEAAIDCSTGSIGVAWVTTKAMLMPMKTTSANWPRRVSRYRP
jgi:hypothetical protein